MDSDDLITFARAAEMLACHKMTVRRLVEAGELEGPGVEWFLHRYLDPLFERPRPPSRLLLACTHYPLLLPALRPLLPGEAHIISQAEVVAEGLAQWLARHPEMETRLGRQGQRRFATTDDPDWFAERGERILGRSIQVDRAVLDFRP